MTSLLEERYRKVLRMLPAGFRREWEDDMVDTFLTRAHRSRPDDPEGVDISGPRWSEVASVARQAVRLRLGAGSGAGPREYVTGSALRRFALAGALAHVTFALSGVLLAVWWTTRLTGSEAGFTSWWRALLSLTGLLWIPAYAGLLSGRPRLAVVLGAAALIPAVVVPAAGPDWPFRLAWLLVLVAPLPAMAAFHRGAPAAFHRGAPAAFHRGAPPVRVWPWVLAVPVLTAVLTTVVAIVPPAHVSVVDLVTVGIAGTALFAVRQPAGAAAAALGCLVVLPLRLTDVAGNAAIVQLVVLLLAGTGAAVRARHGVRRLAQVQGLESADASA
jgi:hypothetical protein